MNPTAQTTTAIEDNRFKRKMNSFIIRLIPQHLNFFRFADLDSLNQLPWNRSIEFGTSSNANLQTHAIDTHFLSPQNN